MRRLLIAFSLLVGLMFQSCDKVEYPRISIEGIDTTLYPGNFADYIAPSFSSNPNTLRNILVEDFTGHQCAACPAAAEVAKTLEEDNPGRVFVASIHAGPSNSGTTDFQKTNAEYPTDYTTEEGKQIASTFFQLGIGFVSNPRGSVSRIKQESGEFMFGQNKWVEYTEAGLITPLQVNLQAKSSYFPETNGVYLHVETDFKANLVGDYNIVVYAIENKRISDQLVGAVHDEEYEHHNIHRGNLFGETWGRNVANGEINAGTKVVTNFSYKLPDDLTSENMHFLIYVYDKATYEILQVIDHHF